ncbi:MAG: tetratricopeptide repeat protein [Bacteroidetes bacterium]|nr:tetratricopeptide repeat protein [Bacteroidota bacterium]MBU1578429.1 tetratricopeptide repeat protein [Bacteroidota bacterium]MBU2557142.1 tetratricopeptide repeat protein [Bacteroidota bacterium]
MKNFLICFFTMLMLVMPFGQASKADTQKLADSLKARLEITHGAEKLNTYQELIKSLRNINPAMGISYSKEALPLAETLGATRKKAEIMNEAAVCYRKLHILEKSFLMHLEALRIFESMEDSVGIAFTLSNLGNVQYAYKDYEEALKYHFKGLLIKEYLQDEPQIAYSQNAIGMVFLEKKNYARALDFFISAMSIYSKYDLPYQIANVKANLAKTMFEMKRYDEAMKYLLEVKEVYSEINANFGLSLIYNQLATYLLAQNKQNEALQMLDKAEQIAIAQNEKSVLLYNYALRQEIAEKNKDYKKALDYVFLTNQLRDSLQNERRHHEMAEIRIQYETKQLDDENEILRLKLSQQSLRNRYIIFALISTISFFILFILFMLFRRNKRKSRLLEQSNVLLEKRVQERTKELEQQITAREKAIQSLKQSEEKFRAINETSPQGIAVTNPQGDIIFLNQILIDSLGLQASTIEEGSWFRHIVLEDRNKMTMLWQNAHQAKEGSFEATFRLRLDQDIRYIHMKAATMFIDQEFSGLVAVFENITQQKLFESELVEARDKAEDSDRLKSAFLANMSHEIRTPMNAILGFSDLLSSDEYEDSEKTEFIEMIKSSGRLLLNLINDIIDISKIEAGELKIQTATFPIIELMDEMYQAFRQQLDRNNKTEVELILHHRSEIANETITTDRLRLQQILTNLLSNAMKFTSKGQIEFGVLCINGEFEFYVRDSGIGIPENKLEVVFERFRQADDSHTRLFGGTGLGLAITKHLTSLLNGKIWVESIVDKGTVFYFTLPGNKSPQQNTHKAEHKLSPALPNLQGKTVLVAEDVDTNFHLISVMLRKMNIEVLHATNGLIALDMAAEHLPDLIIMDIQMPEMDGKEAFERIRHQQLNMPIIAVTAFALLGEEQLYLKLGFDAYLSKPLSFDKLVDLLTLFLISKKSK